MDLNATLNGLGVWGVAIGLVLMIVIQRTAAALGIKLPTTNPTPPANPTPAIPAPAVPEDTPVLDAFLKLLRLKLLAQSQPAQPAPVQSLTVTRDIDHNTVAQLLGVPVDVGKVK